MAEYVYKNDYLISTTDPDLLALSVVTYQIYNANIIDIDTTQDDISPQTAVECFTSFSVTNLAVYINFVIFERFCKFSYVLLNFYVP